MIGYTEAPLAWGYTRGMARALGASLTEAVVEGWMTRAELGRLVAACQACGETQACTAFLARAPDEKANPAFCPNSKALAALKP